MIKEKYLGTYMKTMWIIGKAVNLVLLAIMIFGALLIMIPMVGIVIGVLFK